MLRTQLPMTAPLFAALRLRDMIYDHFIDFRMERGPSMLAIKCYSYQ